MFLAAAEFDDSTDGSWITIVDEIRRQCNSKMAFHSRSKLQWIANETVARKRSLILPFVLAPDGTTSRLLRAERRVGARVRWRYGSTSASAGFYRI
jgi:hypothetical protein